MERTPTIESRRAAVAVATSLLAGLGESVVSVGNRELGPFFRQVDDLSRQVEAARVAILAEALSRGVVASSDCATAAGWVIDWAPSFHAGGAAQLVRVAHATRAVRHAGLAAAVLGARVGVRNAAVALVEMDKLRPRLRDEAVEAVWAGFLQLATDHGPAEIRGLRDKLIATHGHEGEFQRRADQLKHGVSACPSPSMTTGWPSTGCGWTPRARRCWRRCWGRSQRPLPHRPARTCVTPTSAGGRTGADLSAGGRGRR